MNLLWPFIPDSNRKIHILAPGKALFFWGGRLCRFPRKWSLLESSISMMNAQIGDDTKSGVYDFVIPKFLKYNFSPIPSCLHCCMRWFSLREYLGTGHSSDTLTAAINISSFWHQKGSYRAKIKPNIIHYFNNIVMTS